MTKLSIKINEANIKFDHFYLRNHMSFFPADVIGGRNIKEKAKREIKISLPFGEEVFTDLAGDKEIFRKRGWVKKLYKYRNAAPGDRVCLTWVGPYHLQIDVHKSTEQSSDNISVQSKAVISTDDIEDTGSDSDAKRTQRAISIDEFRDQLDRRSEIGEAGEQLAFEDELQRLSSNDVGCPNPHDYVKHVALTDVGRGYDIESTWPGHERCIEVKSSTNSGNAILMSDNERTVLKALGKKAWLYRVVVDANGGGAVVLRLNDPIARIPEENYSTAVWRVHPPKADE